jgi:hypothetical protein
MSALRRGLPQGEMLRRHAGPSDVTLAFCVYAEPTLGGYTKSLVLYVERFQGLAPCSELVIDEGKLVL